MMIDVAKNLRRIQRKFSTLQDLYAIYVTYTRDFNVGRGRSRYVEYWRHCERRFILLNSLTRGTVEDDIVWTPAGVPIIYHAIFHCTDKETQNVKNKCI